MRRTCIVTETRTPRWLQTFTFRIDDGHDSALQFSVKDASADAGSDAVLGQASHDVAHLALHEREECAVALVSGEEGSFFTSPERGELKLRVVIVKESEEVAGAEAGRAAVRGGKAATGGASATAIAAESPGVGAGTCDGEGNALGMESEGVVGTAGGAVGVPGPKAAFENGSGVHAAAGQVCGRRAMCLRACLRVDEPNPLP